MKNNQKDLKEFSKIILGVADNFGGKISNDGISMRFRTMQDYSLEQIYSAGEWLIKHREVSFPPVPTIKEFIDVIDGFSKPKVSIESKAETQANIVLNKLYSDGAACNPVFGDDITQKLMTGRWSFFRWGYDLTNDQVPWWKKEFIAAYKAEAETCKAENLMLCGPDKKNKIPAKNLSKLLQKG